MSNHNPIGPDLGAANNEAKYTAFERSCAV